ncbi:hypothetical protein [Tumebacillus flagellatus]|uniref:Uncharacterized protein n=1 Tax=Tumebacillus flagellatus TaxID=1157490 RepID=A0A074MHX1_9BACL|nr:hypothetical protein [Tumebacillus flagellatus]KEO85287.1 hypothetical protein EL26_01640 [Tumebacillus flagellatus]
MEKKWFAASLALLLTATVSTGTAHAASANDQKGNGSSAKPVLVDRYEAPGTPNASVSTQRASLDGVSCVWDPVTDPGYHTQTCYSNTTYDVVSSRILQYDALPLTDQTPLISVAKGQTKTLSTSQTKSSTVTTKTTVSLPVLKVINLTLTRTETGTVTETYSTTTLYTGPDASSPYNTRTYWSAVTNDLYELTVQQNDHYIVYVYANDGSQYPTYSYVKDVGVSRDVVQAYKPIIVTYSTDQNVY